MWSTTNCLTIAPQCPCCNSGLDEFIEIGKQYDLKYIAINKEQPKNDWFGYLTNLYDEGEKYPFLTKVLDTKEIGFKKFKVKVFEINYDKFITNET